MKLDYAIDRLGEWARSYLVFFILVAALVAVSLLAHLPAPLAVATFASPIAFLLLERWSGVARPQLLLLAHLLVTAAILALVYPIIDLSSDGSLYHSTADLFIAGGWNPIWEPVPPSRHGIYIECYPKAIWYFGALITHWTGSVALAKIHEPAFALTSFFVFLQIFSTWLRIPNLSIRLMLAGVLTFNPVVLVQLMANASDGVVYLTFVLIAAFVGKAIYLGLNRKEKVFLFLLIGFFCNLKFTALIYVCIGLSLAGICVLLSRHYRRRFLPVLQLTLPAVCVGFFVLGANPYLTNAFRYGSPLHPAMGPQRIAFLDWFVDAGMLGRSPLSRFFISTFSFTSNAGRSVDPDRSSLLVKAPLTLRPGEFTSLTVFDTRVGGFGPWFSALVVGACLLLGWMTWRYRFQTAPLWLGVAFVLLCASLNEGSFWARYTPYVWMIALSPLIFQVYREQRASQLTYLLLFIALADLYLVARPNWGDHARLTQLSAIQIGLVKAEQPAGAASAKVAQLEEPLHLYHQLPPLGIAGQLVAIQECSDPASWVAHGLLKFCRPLGVPDANWKQIQALGQLGDPSDYIYNSLLRRDWVLAPLLKYFGGPTWLRALPPREIRVIGTYK